MELFPKIINYINPLSIFAKGSILDVCQYSRYTSAIFKKAVTDKLRQSSVAAIAEYVNDISEKKYISLFIIHELFLVEALILYGKILFE